jgi:DNA-3-methyladenine glycosylase II
MPRISKAVLDAVDELARRDAPMRRLVAKVGPATLKSRHRATPASHFAALAESILFQQLAGRAAAAIHGRFVALFDGTPTPEAVLALPVETLRGVGLSAAKAASIRDLAEKVVSGAVELDRVAALPDDDLVGELTLVRGIGRWTAEMFLIFQLGRLDVWPVDDLGVRKGYAQLYGLDDLPRPKELDALGERFRPYRSVAAWYCWRAADTVTPG